MSALTKERTTRILMVIIGNVFIGLGVGLFKLSALGNDPFDGMNMAMADFFHIYYPVLQIIVNVFFFIFQIWLGRHLIGFGTIVNAFFLGYIAAFFYSLIPAPSAFIARLLIMLVGVLVIALGLSLYQSADMGVAPYDALSMIMAERQKKVPYFWCRVITDAFCAIVCYVFGGIIGIGTVFSAFGFGPFIQFFNTHVSQKLVKNH
ncbi:MAG: hypothetical protein IJV14_14690 [Lachnospiraceae bacterium]|nr:hypothetical protein [Lachnospiraceae bacterium]